MNSEMLCLERYGKKLWTFKYFFIRTFLSPIFSLSICIVTHHLSSSFLLTLIPLPFSRVHHQSHQVVELIAPPLPRPDSFNCPVATHLQSHPKANLAQSPFSNCGRFSLIGLFPATSLSQFLFLVCFFVFVLVLGFNLEVLGGDGG